MEETKTQQDQIEGQTPLVVEIEPAVPSDGSLIRVPCRHNPTLARVIQRVNEDIELHTLWKCANINAVDRLGMSDHGRVHVQIVANIALKLLRLLAEGGLTPSIVKHHGLGTYDAEVVVVLAALFHDIGISIHRDEHEHHTLFLATPKLKTLLEDIYEVEPRTTVVSETLHAIIAHSRDAKTLTIEAGILKIADALDMAKGRSRIPFEAGKVNIHSISAAAIERIIISRGEIRPVRIEAIMSNSAGIFQLDELLKGKLRNSGIEDHIEVVARIEGQAETRLLAEYRIE